MRTTPPPSDFGRSNSGPAAHRPFPTIYEPARAAEPASAGNELSPDEQLARFELELKSADSGHQPC